MGGKLKLFSLIASFILYFVDMGTDAYVGIQHYMNDDNEYFVMTFSFILVSLVICNIFATWAMKAPWYLKTLAFLTFFSMICLFIQEIHRLRKENSGDKAYPCNSEKHFSECGCSGCDERMWKSVKASLKMSHVRSMETFAESVPQWLLQVGIMVHRKSYPWYAIVSITISFISPIVSIYTLEKNYWMLRIIESKQNHIRPASFPKRSAVVFLLWQTFLLLGRLLSIIINILVLDGAFGIVAGAYWTILVLGLAFTVSRSDLGFCLVRGQIIAYWTLFVIYPLLFHVSHSTVACFKKLLPGKEDIVLNVECWAATLLPLLFVAFDGYGIYVCKNDGRKEEFLAWFIAIGCLYAVALLFEIIFYACCHPVKLSSAHTAPKP